jgi:hypothetical protein
MVANIDFVEKPFSDEKLGGALLAAPGGVRDASGSRKRLPSSAKPGGTGQLSCFHVAWTCDAGSRRSASTERVPTTRGAAPDSARPYRALQELNRAT